eukprot:12537903-Alexandrium_andersonii.AAC.1
MGEQWGYRSAPWRHRMPAEGWGPASSTTTWNADTRPPTPPRAASWGPKPPDHPPPGGKGKGKDALRPPVPPPPPPPPPARAKSEPRSSGSAVDANRPLTGAIAQRRQ